MTYLRLLNYLLELKESGVDLGSFDVTIKIEDTGEFFGISKLYEEETSDILDGGTPIISVWLFNGWVAQLVEAPKHS